MAALSLATPAPFEERRRREAPQASRWVPVETLSGCDGLPMGSDDDLVVVTVGIETPGVRWLDGIVVHVERAA